MLKQTHGAENSHLRNVGGLVYHALDENGHRIGVPLKASKFLLKPTLSHLRERFALNQQHREELKDRMQTAIEWSLAGQSPDWKSFQKDLERQGISMVLTGARNGLPEQVYFVDHVNKSVYAGKSLADDYSANDLRNRCAPEETAGEHETIRQHLNIHI